MAILVVVNNLDDFVAELPGVDVVTAKTYLTDPKFIQMRYCRVFNLCRSYRYQRAGYYVSLLAAARGHKAIPDITTIQDSKTTSIVRIKVDELDELIQKTLNPLDCMAFVTHIYFGKHTDEQFAQISQQLFYRFQAPFIRGHFAKNNGKWQLHHIDLMAISDIPKDELGKVICFAGDFFNNRRLAVKKQSVHGYELAILCNPDEEQSPSNKQAIKKFIKAAEELGMQAWTITKDEYHRLGEYDALFIRETTNVNHYTYLFSRRAAVEGMAVIDDPESILKCSNKVYLAELLNHHNVATPQTMVINKDNVHLIGQYFTFPLILKQPDSAFSLGVKKVNNEAELKAETDRMLERSDLIIAQAFLPTEYDWRIGIINQQVLFACKYYMANNHWQIINADKNGYKNRYGRVEAFDLNEVPPEVIKTALKAANLIGDGLYGVDVKVHNNKTYIIEVNDNPNIDAGLEDKILKDDLYKKIMEELLRRIQKLKNTQKP